jgi:hypothetical protein
MDVFFFLTFYFTYSVLLIYQLLHNMIEERIFKWNSLEEFFLGYTNSHVVNHGLVEKSKKFKDWMNKRSLHRRIQQFLTQHCMANDSSTIHRAQFTAHSLTRTFHRAQLIVTQFPIHNSPRTIHRAQFTVAQFTAHNS